MFACLFEACSKLSGRLLLDLKIACKAAKRAANELLTRSGVRALSYGTLISDPQDLCRVPNCLCWPFALVQSLHDLHNVAEQRLKIWQGNEEAKLATERAVRSLDVAAWMTKRWL
jgi:hypothetical protein